MKFSVTDFFSKCETADLVTCIEKILNIKTSCAMLESKLNENSKPSKIQAEQKKIRNEYFVIKCSVSLGKP